MPLEVETVSTPADALTLSREATKLHHEKKFEEAEVKYLEALAISDEEPYILRDYGTLLGQTCRYEQAVAALKKALAIEPNDPIINAQLAIGLGKIGDFDGQRLHYERALDISPNAPNTMWNFSLHKLLMREYQEGWEMYQWGVVSGGRTRRTYKPEWDGRPLPKGANLFVWAEQGFGDTIQFIRFFKQLREHVGPKVRITFEVQPQLFCLFQSLPGVDAVVTQQATGSIPYRVFEHVSLMSLPRVLGIVDEKDFWFGAYCKANGLENAGRGGAPAALKVGACWKGNPQHNDDANRSINKDEFLTALSHPNVELIKLVPGENEELKTWRDTARIISQLDLIVTVDTAVAHLAGAMGKRVWLLLPFIPDWRWSLDRDHTPWYPNTRLIRQPKLGDWATALDELAISLSEAASG